MTLAPHLAIVRLEEDAAAIARLASGVAPEQARWKPSAGEWSIVEVINHLYDEEREDFRQRLDLTLHQPGTPWPPIDPAGWVAARRYGERDLAASLEAFLDERRRSLAWLAGLENPRWENAQHHPVAGSLSAGALLAAWVAHDLLHIRQLAGLHHQYLEQLMGARAVDYAGGW